jgi:hypothetical protein
MKVNFKILILIISSILVLACKTPQRICSDDAVEAQLKNFTGHDGCSWVIVLDKGGTLEPLNLKAFDIDLKDGQKVYVTYKVEPEYHSICMVGPIVRILCIEKRK